MKLSKSSLNAILCTVAFAGACSAPASSRNALSAGATARDFGVASYIVEGGTARLLDRDGIEVGQVVVSVPDADRRLIDVGLTDGTTDQVEVYRPLNGKFDAPIVVNSITTAVVADPALAPMLAQYAIKLSVMDATRLQPLPGFNTEDSANLNRCVGTATDHNLASCTANCDWTSDSPAGCARPGNLNALCTNPSQLAATITQSQYYTDEPYYCTYGGNDCNALCAADGMIVTGITAGCDYGNYTCTCGHLATANQWVASCPRQTCGTAGQYDSVPRLRSCSDPGSCTKSQGTVGCTPYH